jgi:hypothetical protein
MEGKHSFTHLLTAKLAPKLIALKSIFLDLAQLILLGYNTKDPRKEGSLLTLNDYLVLVVVPTGGGPTLELGSETSSTLLQSNLASPWLRLEMKKIKCKHR